MRRWTLLIALACPCLLVGQEAAKVLTPAEAAKKVDEKVTVEMEVKSTGGNSSATFLNSATNFRDPENFTIVVFQSSLERFKKAGIEDPASHFKGKTIQVSGVVVKYRERIEIIAENPEQIKVVGKEGESKTFERRPVKKVPKGK